MNMELSWVTWAILLVSAFAGGLMQASTGFGLSLICMAVYSLVLPVKIALVLQATISVFIIGWYALRLRHSVNIKLIAIPLVFALAGTWIGTETAAYINEPLLRRLLGVALVALSAFALLSRKQIKVSSNFAGQAAAGSVSGVLGGLTNMSGPPMVLYLLQVTDDKDEYNGTLQCFFIVVTLLKAGLNLAAGRITGEILQLLPPLLVASVLGSFAGFRLFARMDMSAVKRAVNLLMIFVGGYYMLF